MVDLYYALECCVPAEPAKPGSRRNSRSRPNSRSRSPGLPPAAAFSLGAPFASEVSFAPEVLIASEVPFPSGAPFSFAEPAGEEERVPLLATTVAAGFPSPADDYVEARIDLNQTLIPRPLSTFFMRVSGDAMAGDGILDGDLLVIDRSVDARPGLVVVATHAGCFVVRRLQGPRRGRGERRLVASDGVSPPIRLADGEAEIWGVVIHAVHHLAALR